MERTTAAESTGNQDAAESTSAGSKSQELPAEDGEGVPHCFPYSPKVSKRYPYIYYCLRSGTVVTPHVQVVEPELNRS